MDSEQMNPGQMDHDTYCLVQRLSSAGARAFEAEGPNLKVGEAKVFYRF